VAIDPEILRIDTEILKLQMLKEGEAARIKALLQRRDARLKEIESDQSASGDLSSQKPRSEH
jgi:hypothetical protein